MASSVGPGHAPGSASANSSNISTLRPRLVPLRTNAEVQASNETITVYITQIPTKSNSAILSRLKDVFLPVTMQPLQHLRRIVKPELLPTHLQTSSPDVNKTRKSHLLIGPESAISLRKLERLINKDKELKSLWSPFAPVIKCIPVPAFAPTTATQAADWSERYWPTMYKNTNPYGPHPAIVRRAELEILEEHGEHSVEYFMELAKNAGQECKERGFGNGAGAVVVNRVPLAPLGDSAMGDVKDKAKETTAQPKVARIVAVAGDVSYKGWTSCEDRKPSNDSGPCCDQGQGGNPMGHAVMRIISFVARKRREVSGVTTPRCNIRADLNPMADAMNPFVDTPLTPVEVHHLAQPSLAPNGYLCLDLEIYITHEPCVMCCMAMLHSRFGRIIFEYPRPGNGALSSERLERDGSNNVGSNSSGTLGYGLFWRPELNWRCLCWRYEDGALHAVDTDEDEQPEVENAQDDVVKDAQA